MREDDEKVAAAALKEAIAAAGGQSELARKLEISRQAVHRWKVAPVRHVRALSELSGVSLDRLRPDLYGDYYPEGGER